MMRNGDEIGLTKFLMAKRFAPVTPVAEIFQQPAPAIGSRHFISLPISIYQARILDTQAPKWKIIGPGKSQLRCRRTQTLSGVCWPKVFRDKFPFEQ
jgi:hypothetical protein